MDQKIFIDCIKRKTEQVLNLVKKNTFEIKI